MTNGWKGFVWRFIYCHRFPMTIDGLTGIDWYHLDANFVTLYNRQAVGDKRLLSYLWTCRSLTDFIWILETFNREICVYWLERIHKFGLKVAELPAIGTYSQRVSVFLIESTFVSKRLVSKRLCIETTVNLLNTKHITRCTPRTTVHGSNLL